MKKYREDRWLGLILLLSLCCVIALACAWELWLEGWFDRAAGIFYDETYEQQSAWWFIVQCSAFAALGFLPGGYVAQRLMRKLRDSIDAERQARNKAEGAARAKMFFLANMSHELRTPLNAIIGFSEINMTSKNLTPQQQREYCEIIHKSGNHLLSVVNDVLDIARSEEGKLSLSARDFDIWQTLEDAVELNLPQAKQRDVAIVMPQDHIPLIVHADAQRTRQAVCNLLSNAVKFTLPGGHVSITAQVCNGAADLEISDTGIGIASADLERVMHPFEQADNSLTRKYDGTGLGLPLVKRFIEAMGGKLQLASELGKGTQARITLPLAVRQQAGAPLQMVPNPHFAPLTQSA